MTVYATTYVYRNPDGSGYCGRSPQSGATLAARPGDVVDDATIAALGLNDLDDHTDYAAIYAAAVDAGAPITVPDKDGTTVIKAVKATAATVKQIGA